MRRSFRVFLCVLILLVCILPVQALSSASASVHTTVSSDGECQVVITATIHLEQQVDDLSYPIPRNAYSVKLDGSRARVQKTASAQLVDLSKKAGKMTGDLPITITYSLSDVVVQTETGTQVQIPLLSGFPYPIEEFEFSVTLPGEVTAKPAFSGGYQMAGIEKDLVYEISGPKISGSAVTELMDSETLLFTVDVPQSMFPRTSLYAPDLNFTYIAMGICAGLALLYWLLTMRSLPPRRIRESTPPEGYSAGQLGCLLTLQGADLTMMIFSWAQLGYVTIHREQKGHITVHKHMEMGNERSSFERQCFQKLFRKSQVADTASWQYALLRKAVAEKTPDLQSLVHKRSGNPKIFRVLSGLIALFCGGCLGIAISTGAILQWLLAILLAGLGFLAGWYVQGVAYSLFTMDRRPVRNGLIICLLWLLIGLLAGQFGVALLGCLSQLLAGLMCAFGGLRTENGRQLFSQVLALRRYLRSLSPSQLQQLLQTNPDYFHTIAPYAMALGVDRQLAAYMGKTPLPAPSYLHLDSDKQLSALKWSQLMRQIAMHMDARYRKLPVERFYEIIHSLIK